MVTRRSWLASGLGSVVLLASGACEGESNRTMAKDRADRDASSFAVVELFTSEGCSSCPPADQFLSELVRDARTKGQRVFPLSFHVDYWDRLGWKDPFSDHAWSKRQEQYARAFRLGTVYTPQMIVNGATEFVGSDRGKGRRAIDDALRQASKTSVELTVRPAGKEALMVTYTISGAPRGAMLNLALVERGLETEVPRGENAGRKLIHDNVVRAFRTIELRAGRGEERLAMPEGVAPKRASVIAYVQDPAMRIVGAAAADIAAAEAMMR